MSLRKTDGMEAADTDSDPYGSKNAGLPETCAAQPGAFCRKNAF